MRKFITHLQENFGFSKEEVEEIVPLFEKVTFEKNDFLIQQMGYSDQVFFIQEGLVREFFTHDNVSDEDNTTQFVSEGDFYFSTYAAIEDQRSTFFTQALEPVNAMMAKKGAILELLYKSFTIDRLVLLIMADSLLREEKSKRIFMKTRKAAERYNLFNEVFPQLQDRISDKYVASFLQINSSTLSRIRSKK
ncbi:MAG: cyclic nucleotide-binding domain-containing protein [Cytophagales bacterium]|nr:cyclic nucleotide-binding domain-containing protein [Cytophagales bacterium]